MKKNSDIEIISMANGFVVRSVHYDKHTPEDNSCGKVFQSMAELIDFIRNHFEHRAVNLLVDTFGE